jgi:cytosine/adenosine deaminase-related metal-dependent hydrolase
MAEGAASVTALCEIAARRGLRVDMHCDETDDPLSRHIETLSFETQRLGLQGRVAGSHLTSMHSMDNYFVSKLLPLMAEAGVAAVANPLINIVIQGRHDTYPKRRGMTRIPEMRTQGILCAFGHDCVMDPWYPLGSGDMLDVAHMAVHVGQLTSRDAMRFAFDAVTVNPAEIIGPRRVRPRGRLSRGLRTAAGERSNRSHPPQGDAADGRATGQDRGGDAGEGRAPRSRGPSVACRPRRLITRSFGAMTACGAVLVTLW